MQTCNKADKELAVEAAVEYAKSWNAHPNALPMKAEVFLDVLKAAYETIKNFD